MDHLVQDAMNMTAAMGGDLAENAEDIARVLETGVIPRTWGFSIALRTAILDKVKAGDTTKALADTLGELDTRFGGQSAAASARSTGNETTRTTILKRRVRVLGKYFLPALTALAQDFDIIISVDAQNRRGAREHQAAIQKTSQSYMDYAFESIRAYDASKGLSGPVVDDQIRKGLLLNGVTEDEAKNLGMLTELEWSYQKSLGDAGVDIDKMRADQWALQTGDAGRRATPPPTPRPSGGLTWRRWSRRSKLKLSCRNNSKRR